MVDRSPVCQRTVQIGSQSIVFKRIRPKELLSNDRSALVLQALRFLGKEAVTDKVMKKIQQILLSLELKRFLKDAMYTSDWVAEIARRLVAGKGLDIHDE